LWLGWGVFQGWLVCRLFGLGGGLGLVLGFGVLVDGVGGVGGAFLGVEDGAGWGLGCLCARAGLVIVLKMVLILLLWLEGNPSAHVNP